MKKQYVRPVTETCLLTPHGLLCNSIQSSIYNRQSGGDDDQGGYDAANSLSKEEDQLFSGW